MAHIYDIIVIGDFDFNKKIKKNNVKMLIYNLHYIQKIFQINEIDEVGKENLIPDYHDYDYLSDLL